jgi:hypothetical protein
VRIITHEGDSVPFELTNADTLTQFFTDYNNIRTGLRTYIVDEKVSDYIDLVSRPNYSKELCDLKTLKSTIMVNDENGPSSVTFLFCRGSRRGSDYPAFLSFGEDRVKHIVWACRKNKPKRDVILQDLIYKSKLVLMMCCSGDEILQDYLAEQGNKIPDILFYNCEIVLKTTHVIFLALLISLIDSDERLRRNPYEDDVCLVVRDGIITILKIVKWCNNDKNELWNFLLEVGCISTYESENRKQGLPIPVTRFKDWKSHYRVFGHMYNDFIQEKEEQQIFNDFKALTLVSAGETQPLYQNYESVDPLRERERERASARARANAYIKAQYGALFHRQQEALTRHANTQVCKNGSRLYYTPNDVNLSIKDRTSACISEASSAVRFDLSCGELCERDQSGYTR